MKALLCTIFTFSFCAASQAKWPEPPLDRSHPGSAIYDFSLFRESFKVGGRTIDFFAPAEVKDQNKKVPLIVFGHGQAIGLDGYDKTFEHLAKKGIAVAFVEFDKGFFDTDWKRMAEDFKNLSNEAVSHYSQYINPEMIVFSGHSKGAYVALMAAGLADSKVKSLVLLAPAGYDADLLNKIPATTPVTLIWGEADNIIKFSAIKEIYDRLKVEKKQLIKMKTYPNVRPSLEADHFVSLNKHYFFGGRDGITPFHYYGTWKWLYGAAQDVAEGSKVNNVFVYGDQTLTTGLDGFFHEVVKSWSN